MPHVMDPIQAMRNIKKMCDACCKVKATYYVAPIAGRTRRNLFFCDKCMGRNSHLLFNAGREIEKFSATEQRRKNNDDLPDMIQPDTRSNLKGFGTL